MCRESIVGYYYGLLVYENLRSGASRLKTYGQSIMKITKKRLLKLANRLLAMTKDSNRVQHSVEIVPAPFCALRYVNDG